MHELADLARVAPPRALDDGHSAGICRGDSPQRCGEVGCARHDPHVPTASALAVPDVGEEGWCCNCATCPSLTQALGPPTVTREWDNRVRKPRKQSPTVGAILASCPTDFPYSGGPRVRSVGPVRRDSPTGSRSTPTRGGKDPRRPAGSIG